MTQANESTIFATRQAIGCHGINMCCFQTRVISSKDTDKFVNPASVESNQTGLCAPINDVLFCVPLNPTGGALRKAAIARMTAGLSAQTGFG